MKLLHGKHCADIVQRDVKQSLVGKLGSIPSSIGGGKKLNEDLTVKEVFEDHDHLQGHGRKEIVASKRLPEEFIAETLIPHMDRLITRYIVAHTPAMLSQLVTCYATYTNMRTEGQNIGPLIERLMDTIKYRMAGYEAADIVASVGPCYALAPDDTELFEMFLDRLKMKQDDLSALNLLGLMRIYSKLAGPFISDLHGWMIPRLVIILKEYDNQEICDILISLASASATDSSVTGDVHSLLALVPELERRLTAETPLDFFLQADALWALSRLGVQHDLLTTSVADRLSQPATADDLPVKYLCRLFWVFSKLGQLDRVAQPLASALSNCQAYLTASDFARLAQAQPSPSPLPSGLLEGIGSRLQAQIAVEGLGEDRNRKDFCFLLSGLARLDLLEKDPASTLFRLISENSESFSEQEIRQVILALWTSPMHRDTLKEYVPKSWSLIAAAAVKPLQAFSA